MDALDNADREIKAVEVQIAAIEIINGIAGREFEVFINTDKDLTESEKIHNISKEYLNKNSIDAKLALNNLKGKAMEKFGEYKNMAMRNANTIVEDAETEVDYLKMEEKQSANHF